MERVIIKELFPIREQEIIIAHLNTFDWDFDNFGDVFLCFGNQRIKMRYVASGNHEGNPTLSLKLCDPRFSSIEEIFAEIKNANAACSVERETDESRDK